jgi:nucleotide-binding universal stress UspA family protein
VATIVVGVDGSEGSARALRFALEEARAHGAAVRAVSAWHVPIGFLEGGWATDPVSLGDFEQLARSTLERALAQSGAAESDVEVSPVVREGQPAEVLLDEAREATLLVVGSRGLGGFKGLLLGSVSRQLAQHAPCPIVIVPDVASEPAPTADG